MSDPTPTMDRWTDADLDKAAFKRWEGGSNKHANLRQAFRFGAHWSLARSGGGDVVELREALERVTDHLEVWSRDHSDEATTETAAAIYCARAALSRIEAGGGALPDTDSAGQRRAAVLREVKAYASRDDVGSSHWLNALVSRIMVVTK